MVRMECWADEQRLKRIVAFLKSTCQGMETSTGYLLVSVCLVLNSKMRYKVHIVEAVFGIMLFRTTKWIIHPQCIDILAF